MPESAQNISGRRKWGGLAVLSLALAIIIIDTTLITVSLRYIVKDLNTTLQNLQWVITGYSLVLTAFTITGGRLGDLFGRKRMFIAGALLFAIGSVTAATAHNYTQLLLGASLIEGLGAALMTPNTASLILANFHGRERATAFGVWGGVAGAAAAFGPLVGGYLTSYYTWRYGYGINVFIVALLLLTSWLVTDPRQEAPNPSIDYGGIGLSVLGLGAVVYGIVQSSSDGWFKAKQTAHIFNHQLNLGDYSVVPLALGLGVALLIMFLLWEAVVELRGKTPLVSLQMFSNRPFVVGLVTMMIVAMGQFGAMFTMPVFFQGVRGLDAFHTGLAFLPFSLTVLLTAPISGALGSKKIPPKYLIVAGLAITALGMFYVGHSFSTDATNAHLRFPLIVFGLGFGMAFAQLNNIILSAVRMEEAGEASGLNNTSRQLGATLGNAVLGSILLSALVANISNEISNSPQLPAALKPSISESARAQAQSLGQQTGSRVASLPPQIAGELSQIRNQSTVAAVKHAFNYGVAIVAAGAIISLGLPRAEHAAPPDEKKPQPVTASSSAPVKPEPSRAGKKEPGHTLKL